jgi:hypothetical protein
MTLSPQERVHLPVLIAAYRVMRRLRDREGEVRSSTVCVCSHLLLQEKGPEAGIAAIITTACALARPPFWQHEPPSPVPRSGASEGSQMILAEGDETRAGHPRGQ